MSGLEALKYLTIRSGSLLNTGRGGPSWEDVAGQLGRASDIAATYGRYKYCLEHKWHKKIINYLYRSAKELKWKKHINNEDIRMIVNLALFESVNPWICPKCNGRKQVMILDKLYKCDLCHGSGIKGMTNKIRSTYTEKKEHEFIHNIKYNYFNYIIPIIEEWEMELQKVFYPYRKVK